MTPISAAENPVMLHLHLPHPENFSCRKCGHMTPYYETDPNLPTCAVCTGRARSPR